MSPAAMIVAVLALVLAGAGVGWSASQVTTKDLKNNAVTSPKVKNGTLKAADLVKEKKATPIAAPGGPEFTDGGQGDCEWAAAASTGGALPGFRTDRFGMVHLSGVAQGLDDLGGDADCDQGSQEDDGVVMVLPKTLRPGANLYLTQPGGGLLYLTGPEGLPGLAPGSVYVNGSYAFLDGISYYPSTSPLAERSAPGARPAQGVRAVLRQLAGR